MNKLYVAFGLLLSLNGIGQSMNLVKVGPEEKISFKIPNSLASMTDEDRMSRVNSTKVPLGMYSHESQEVTLGVNYNIMKWTEDDTDLIYGFYKASINNLFDEVKFIQDEIKMINGKEFIVFEFIGEIQDDNAFSAKASQKSYSYIAYTSWKDQVLLFNFSCKARLSNQWSEVPNEIMESIKIK